MKIKYEDKVCERLDLFLKKKLDGFSRTDIQKKIKEGLIKINNKVVYKTGYSLNENDEIEITQKESKLSFSSNPKNVKLDLQIIYEDENIIVINKPAFVLTHPAKNSKEPSLLETLIQSNKLIYRLKEEDLRPGVVHRLDKNTTGLIVFAKNKTALLNLQKQFASRNVEKKYFTIVHNPFDNKKVLIDLPLRKDKKNFKKQSVQEKGKASITEIDVISQTINYAFISCDLKTGRNHQIRAHLSAINHPLYNDKNYNSASRSDEFFLHCYYLSFINPGTQKKQVFSLKPPHSFINKLLELNLLNKNTQNDNLWNL